MPYGQWQRYRVDLNPRTGPYYYGEDPVLRRYVSIKKVKDEAANAEQEAILMAHYGYSPFLPQVYDYFAFGSDGYIVMEYLPGERLGNDPKIGPKREATKAVRIVMNVLRGLRQLHEKGRLHTSIEPRSIMISEGRSATVKLTDFSASVRIKPEGGWKGPCPGGTWEYMPPEQFVPLENFKPPAHLQGEVRLDERSDLYSVACVLYFLLNGRAPFFPSEIMDPTEYYAECMFRHKAGQAGDWDERIPEELKAALEKALAPEPENRPANSQEFMNLLRSFEK